MIKRKSKLKTVFSRCVVFSQHRIDIVNAKSIGKKKLKVLVTERSSCTTKKKPLLKINYIFPYSRMTAD